MATSERFSRKSVRPSFQPALVAADTRRHLGSKPHLQQKNPEPERVPIQYALEKNPCPGVTTCTASRSDPGNQFNPKNPDETSVSVASPTALDFYLSLL
jgi:hypothetical protein